MIVTYEHALRELNKLANQDKCDGACDEYPPYRVCPECEARFVLNKTHEMITEAYYKIFTE